MINLRLRKYIPYAVLNIFVCYHNTKLYVKIQLNLSIPYKKVPALGVMQDIMLMKCMVILSISNTSYKTCSISNIMGKLKSDIT